jgi:hypothetical protein
MCLTVTHDDATYGRSFTYYAVDVQTLRAAAVAARPGVTP